MKNILRRIIENLKYIVPTACFVSVIIVFAIALKVDDLKNQKEDRDSAYQTAEEEFFGEENNTENENITEEDEKDDKEIVYGITTYDVNSLGKNTVEEESSEDENTVDENETQDDSTDSESETYQEGSKPRPTSYSEDGKKDAIQILEDAIDKDEYDINYKEFSVDGYYIFNVKNKEDGTEVEKAVDIANKSTETVIDEEIDE